MVLKKVNDISPTMGCDPEFFFKLEGEVIGAEKFLPKDGLIVGASKFIIDGVQAELNPQPYGCRANLANEIKRCMVQLDAELKKRGKGITPDFGRAVEISAKNLADLAEESRKFGCAPSNNVHSKKASEITVNPETYRVRAAGGHIHIGKGATGTDRALTTDHKRTVQMLDLICGNTAVLVDRDPANIERRKVYGRAGEYRLPQHGLEYRTLSNFWLTAYPLMSFAFGQARLAVQLMADAQYETYYDAFMSKVKLKKVADAINHNDYDLAAENYLAIEPLMLEVTSQNDRYPIHSGNNLAFHHFVNKIQTDGLAYWFKQDPMTHWLTIGECHTGGFTDFLNGTVKTDLKKCEAEKKAA